MTISSTSNKAQFSGSGTTGPFPFTFKVFDSGDLDIIKTSSLGVDTTLTITTHYTVSLNADQNNNPGGSVTLVSSLAVGETLTILRTVDATQETDIANGGGFYPEVIENALDRVTMLCQQNAEVISRAVVAGATEDPQAFIQSIFDSEASAAASAAAASASAASASSSASAASASAVAAAASAANAATGVQTQLSTRFTAAGTADAITGALSPAIASYAAGLRVTATPGGANTVTGPTLNLNSLGTKTIKKRDSGGTKVALVAGDYNASGPFDFEYDGTDFILLNPVQASATVKQIQPISASVGANALTISASALSLDFRSTTLGSGTITTVSGTPANLVISSGSTLGTVNAVQSRIAVLALNNAGTIELAAVNTAGSINLDESGVISTTAEGGAGAADSISTIYSTTARTNVPYRVLGYIESTQATAGTWATAPSAIQGAGGQASVAMAMNASGSAPMFACRAWVNFDGTGTVAIRGSRNVSSITDNGTGDYTVNFINSMPDVNYACIANADVVTTGAGSQSNAANPRDFATGSVRIATGNTSTGAALDMAIVGVTIFR